MTIRICRWLAVLLLGHWISLLSVTCGADKAVDVEPVWSGHPVGFALWTHPPHQFVAYYNADRQMTVAQRRLDQQQWTFARLPSQLGWDSHNSVTMTLDRSGYLHVAGNMHCVPLVYFRSTLPLQASTLKRVLNMVDDQREQRVTYPVFLRGPNAQLIFRYRDGRSGNGDDIYNRFDETTGSWQRLLDGPLVSGEGQRNAYCSRPTLGPDDWYHLVWVWRDTPDCATNHDLSYARSRDLIHWVSASGTPLDLPITYGTETVVDPVPPGGGLINGGHALGFDQDRRPIITFHKYDAAGDTQIYLARLTTGRWQIVKISPWSDYRWQFQGGGSIPFEVRVSAVQTLGDDRLQLRCTTGRGKHRWLLDTGTLQPIAPSPVPEQGCAPSAEAPFDAEATRNEGTSEEIGLSSPDASGELLWRTVSDSGFSGEAGVVYQLRWQTLGPNRDRPRDPPWPVPSMLRVLRSER